MKKTFLYSCIFAMSLILMACPYESKVPIDEPTTKINPKLLGLWQDEGKTDNYQINRLDEFTYSIEAIDLNKNKTERYFAHLTDVNGTTFLNLRENKSDAEKKFILYKIEFSGDNELKIYPLTENIQEKFNSSTDLKKFIAENMKNSYFFEKTGNLSRVEKK